MGTMTVRGKVKSVDEKRSEIVINTNDGKELKLPYNLAHSLMPGKPLPTTLLISAKGSTDLLKPNMIIHIGNVKFDWSDPYKLKGYVTLFPFKAAPDNRLDFTGTNESYFSAVVVKTDPLQVRIIGKDVPVSIDSAKGKEKPMRFLISQKTFEIAPKDVTVDLAQNFVLAGKEPSVYAIVVTPANTAQQLQIKREDAVTEDEWKKWTKKK